MFGPARLRLVVLAIGLSLISWKSLAQAEAPGRFSFFVLGEHWHDPTLNAAGRASAPLHGAVMLAWDLDELPRDARLGVELNTDTLRLELAGFRLQEGLEVGLRLTGEAAAANLLMDYFQQGGNRPERGFRASFLLAQSWLKIEPRPHLFVHLELGARKWFFGRSNATSAAFVLPPEASVFEPRLHMAWWDLADDAAWRDRHRIFPRLRGLAAGLSLGLDLRSEAGAWGAQDPGVFDPVDPRNRPEALQAHGVQWLWAGWEPSAGRVRLQLVQELGWAAGEDDLNRRQIGGLNPYVVNIPGAPWAYFHAGDYMALQWSTHLTVVEGLEVGPLIGAAGLRDLDRVGSEDFGWLWGLGGFVDWRWGAWQLNLRGGISPALRSRHSQQQGWSLLWQLGWASDG